MWAMLVASVLLGTRPCLAGDPRLAWYTIESGRFRVHFHGGLEGIAQRAIQLAVQIDEQLVELLGARDTETVEILLDDVTDTANGSASVLPYSNLQLHVTAPDDMNALGEHDDWLSSLMSHESTHIAHMDRISGLPALLNAILGKQFSPNQLQPRWLIEGLAVYAETRLSSGGRLRSPLWEMMLRADVLDQRFAPLDQITGDPLRWPPGIYYLYGSKFVEFIAELYGPSVFASAIQDASNKVIPFAVSRPFYRATGRTIEQLYEAFQRSTERRVHEQLARITARGLREGRPLTAHGRIISSPRIVPERCRRTQWHGRHPAPFESRAQDESVQKSPGADPLRLDALIYFRDDGHERAGYYELALEDSEHGAVSELLVARSDSGKSVSVAPDCSLWFESVAPSQRLHYLTDLFRQLPASTAPSGVEASRVRATVGRRALDPDVAPDGRSIVYVTNRAGTTTLRIASIDGAGNLEDERILVPSAHLEQVFTPRFAPDGKTVAYSVWTQGGYRDLRIVDIGSGRVTQPWKDRAIDQQPRFSPDGQYLYFSSDRSGISNIYAYDWLHSKLWQVTNVRTGAFMPELSADGRQLFYVGYSSRGYDLYVLPLDPSRFVEAPNSTVQLDDRLILEQRGDLPARPYSALSTLRPRALYIDYRTDASGQRLILKTSGSDIVGLHSAEAMAVFEPEGRSPDLYLSYGYWRLPSNFSTTIYRIVDPNNSYSYGTIHSNIDEVRVGASTRIDLPFPREFDRQYVWAGYIAESVSATFPMGTAADPFATLPHAPRRGISSRIQLGYSFSNTEGSLYGIGDERGLQLTMIVDEAHRGLGSELEGTSMSGRVTGYVLMPWLRHHVLALSGRGGASTGDATGGYSLGGYQDSALLNSVLDGVAQNRSSLRGYPGGRFRGRRMLLGQGEYRFPLMYPGRGYSTLPIFVRTISGSFGIDAGGAFNSFDPHAFDQSIHWGFSSELWFDVLLAYRMSTRLVIGYAAGRGVGAFDGGTGYLIVGSGL